jgi:hypothetical protein
MFPTDNPINQKVIPVTENAEHLNYEIKIRELLEFEPIISSGYVVGAELR